MSSASRVISAFSTPILKMNCDGVDDLNKELARVILVWEQVEPSVCQSNKGGWQSAKDLHSRTNASLTGLISILNAGVHSLISGLFNEWVADELACQSKLRVWANVNRRGHFNRIHYHEGGIWSGVYYVATPTPRAVTESSEGALILRSSSMAHMVPTLLKAPRPIPTAFSAEVVTVPSPGLLLIFPSWLEHYVLPHSGDEPRISVAFDVYYEGSMPQQIGVSFPVK